MLLNHNKIHSVELTVYENQTALFRAKMKMRYCFVVSWEDKTASGKRETFEFALLNSLTLRLARI